MCLGRDPSPRPYPVPVPVGPVDVYHHHSPDDPQIPATTLGTILVVGPPSAHLDCLPTLDLTRISTLVPTGVTPAPTILTGRDRTIARRLIAG